MLENNRHLLACCVVCGAVLAYLVSIYVFVLVVVAGVFLLVIDFKLLEQIASITKAFSFPVPSWIKTIITALMNSYHLSKPLEPEPSARRGSQYSPNVPIPRRPSCRGSRYTCLDENTDYVNRRNGIGLCNPSVVFNSSYSNSLHGFRRQSNFSDTDNSSKIEDFSTPQTSPWTRRQNYNGSDYINVRRVQTVAGPLLASSGLTKRKSNDFGLLVDASSPGLASRIVQYREEGMSASSSVWTHQPQYSSPGQFPMVHLSHSPSSLPVLSPLSSQKASRRSVRVKIAPPDPLGSRLYPLSTKNNTTYTTNVQADHSTKSVLETLKEISRKRIHSQLEDNDDDAAKRQKCNGPSDLPTTLTNDDASEAENVSKRLREESPRQQEISPPIRPIKRIRNNEILSSLSSSRKLLQSGGIKRKTHNLDWSRCSTPVLGKQQKTVEEDSPTSPSSVPSVSREKTSLAASESVFGPTLEGENVRRSGQRSKKSLANEKKNELSSTKTPVSGKEARKVTPKAISVIQVAKKVATSPISDAPWQKDSPFVLVSSPDDVIDDVSALEEKREEDRRSRLMSMMAVISGGEPPVKMLETVVSQSVTMNSITSTTSISKTTFSVDSNSLLSSSVTSSSVTPNIFPEKALFATSIANDWGSNTGSPKEAMPVTNLGTIQASQPIASPTPSILTPTSGTVVPKVLPTSSPMFSFGNTVSPSTSNVAQKTQDNAVLPISFTTPSTASNSQLPIIPAFGSPSTSVSTPQTIVSSSPPVFGSTTALFGSKTSTSADNALPFNNQNQQTINTITPTTSTDHHSFGFTSVSNTSFAVPTASSQLALTSAPASATVAISSTSSPTSSVFQLRPAVSGLGQENSVSSSSGVFSASIGTTSAGQTNAFTKTATFGAPEKPIQNPQFHASNSTPSSTVLLGSSASTAGTATIASPAAQSFAFGASLTSTAPTSGLQTKSGIFSFGNSSTPSVNTHAISSTGNSKSVFGSVGGGFGQPVEATASHTVASSHQVNSQPLASKVGGFKFDLCHGKSVFSTQPNVSSSSSPNLFGNPDPAAGTTEPKPFAFGSGKPVENPFALNAGSNNSATTVSQSQTPVNPFGSPAIQQKTSDGGQIKESLFSFGGSSTAGTVFPTRPTGGFSVQSIVTTTATTGSNGFSFSSAPSGGFSQPGTGTSGFSVQPAVASTSNFSTPAAGTTVSTTAANPAFSFGNTAPNQTPQTNMFGFGASTSTTEQQPGGMFAFGSGSSVTPSSSTGLFGQSVTPAASAQPQAGQVQASAQAPAAGPAPTQPFQFGNSNSTPQLSGTFSFGASSAVNTAAGGFPSGGSFQVNTGGFGSGPAMFSIGSGSTAPRVRNARTRRTK